MKTPVRQVAFVGLAMAAFAVFFGACGGPTTPGVVGDRSLATTNSPLLTSRMNAQFARFGSCMRSHAEPEFQNPIANGNSVTFSVNPSLGVGTPRYAHAIEACRRLLPPGFTSQISPTLPPGMQQITQADEVDYLKAVACIRAHGFQGVPDPTFAGGGVHIKVPDNIDQNSKSFQRAVSTCRKSIPVGLPYGR